MNNPSVQAFAEEFEQTHGDRVHRVLMARLRAAPSALRAFGLEYPPGKTDIWGLLIFGERALHFFVHASESSMSALFRTAMQGAPPKEQYAVFGPEQLADIQLPVKKNGLFRLFSRSADTITVQALLPDRTKASFFFESVLDPGDLREHAARLLAARPNQGNDQ